MKVDSDAAGNVNMIEKLVLGGTVTGDLLILSPTRYTTNAGLSEQVRCDHASNSY